MYPNPQDALPLPSRPNIEQYKKLAKELVKACKSNDATAIRAGRRTWIQALAALHKEPDALRTNVRSRRGPTRSSEFARQKLTGARSRAAR